MLPGQGATGVDAGPQDVASCGEDALDFIRIAFVEEDHRMQVAVPGMEDIGDPQVVFLGDRPDLAQHFGEFGAGRDPVLGGMGRCESAQRPNRLLAGGPELGAFCGILGPFDPDGPAGCADGGDPVGEAVESGLGSVHLDQQDRTGIRGQPQVVDLFDDAQDGLVDHFEGCGDDAGGDDVRDQLGCGVDRVADGEQGADGLGRADHADRGFGDYAQRALGPDQNTEQVVSGVVAVDLNHFPGGQDDLGGQDVVDGDTVFEGVGAACVVGDVAPEGAGALGRWIGGVEQTFRGDRAGEGCVDNAGFGADGAVFGIDRENAVHARQAEQALAGSGEGPAGESGSGAPGDDRDRPSGAESDNGCDLFR